MGGFLKVYLFAQVFSFFHLFLLYLYCAHKQYSLISFCIYMVFIFISPFTFTHPFIYYFFLSLLLDRQNNLILRNTEEFRSFNLTNHLTGFHFFSFSLFLFFFDSLLSPSQIPIFYPSPLLFFSPFPRQQEKQKR